MEFLSQVLYMVCVAMCVLFGGFFIGDCFRFVGHCIVALHKSSTSQKIEGINIWYMVVCASFASIILTR